MEGEVMVMVGVVTYNSMVEGVMVMAVGEICNSMVLVRVMVEEEIYTSMVKEMVMVGVVTCNNMEGVVIL
jgi:hypothetical protein